MRRGCGTHADGRRRRHGALVGVRGQELRGLFELFAAAAGEEAFMGGCRFWVVCLSMRIAVIARVHAVTSCVSEACANVGGWAGATRACREAGKRKVIPPPVACGASNTRHVTLR